jgi:hypothetical protein
LDPPFFEQHAWIDRELKPGYKEVPFDLQSKMVEKLLELIATAIKQDLFQTCPL